MVRRVIEILIGIVLLIAAFGLALYFQQTFASGMEYQSFPVPVADIEPYTILTSDMFHQKDYPRVLNTGYITDVSALIGKISTSRIPNGLPIPAALIGAPEEFRFAPPEKEVLSIPISPSSAVGGRIAKGDKVNIYRLAPPTRAMENGIDQLVGADVKIIAKNIVVVAVLSSSGTDVGSTDGKGPDLSAQILVLSVTPMEAQDILKVIAEVKQNIQMWITLAPISS